MFASVMFFISLLIKIYISLIVLRIILFWTGYLRQRNERVLRVLLLAYFVIELIRSGQSVAWEVRNGDILMILLSVAWVAIYLYLIIRYFTANFDVTPVERTVAPITDPFLDRFRGAGWLRVGTVDFSPVIAIVLLSVVLRITETLAAQGTITAWQAIAIVIASFWSLFRFLGTILAVLIFVRMLFLLVTKSSHPILDGLDRFLFPRVSRVMGLFTSKPLPYAAALAITGAVLVIVLVAANFGIRELVQLLYGL